MEPDCHRHFRETAVISTTRIPLQHVTREAEIQMLEELPRATRLLQTTAPDIIVFGCTSAGSLDGLAHDTRIGKLIEQESGTKAITVLQAVLAQFGAIQPRRIAVFTPYAEELTESVARCVVEGGYAVVKAAGMGLRENLAIGRVTPAEIASFVESHARGTDADCVFLSCTNWRAVEAIELLKSQLGIATVSSNQAVIAALERGSAATV